MKTTWSRKRNTKGWSNQEVLNGIVVSQTLLIRRSKIISSLSLPSGFGDRWTLKDEWKAAEKEWDRAIVREINEMTARSTKAFPRWCALHVMVLMALSLKLKPTRDSIECSRKTCETPQGSYKFGAPQNDKSSPGFPNLRIVLASRCGHLSGEYNTGHEKTIVHGSTRAQGFIFTAARVSSIGRAGFVRTATCARTDPSGCPAYLLCTNCKFHFIF